MFHGYSQHWTLNYLGRPQAVEFPPFLTYGVLTHKNAGQTFSTGFGTASWQVEDYDVTGWHDNSVNNTRHTVPTGVAVVRVQSNWRAASENNPNCRQIKSGATFKGMAQSRPVSTGAGTNAGFQGDNLNSALIEVTPTQYFETQYHVSSGTSSWGDHNMTWMATEEIDASLRRALVTNSGTQSISAATETTVTAWDTVTYDEGGWFSLANSSFIVPSGVTLVRVTVNVALTGASGRAYVRIWKNGATVRGTPIVQAESNSTEYVNAVTAVLEVTAGDEFKVRIAHAAASGLTVDDASWFCIEEVPSTHKRVLLYRNSGTHSVTTTAAAVVWQAAVYDTDTMWSSGTPTVVTAPSGITQARPSWGMLGSNVGNGFAGWVHKNGATYYGTPSCHRDSSGSDGMAGMGAWVDCSPGDTFELIADTTTNRTVGTDNETYFCMEFR